MKEYRGKLGGRPWTGWRVQTESDLDVFRDWVSRQRGVTAVDTETMGLDVLSGPGYVRLVQFGNMDEAWVIPVEYGAPFVSAATWAVETLPQLSGHNAPFDAMALWRYAGIDLDLMMKKWQDTQVRAKLIDPRKDTQGGLGHKLKVLSSVYVDPDAPDTQDGLHEVFKDLGCGHTVTNQTGWAHIDIDHDLYNEYAALDVILTARILPLLDADLSRVGVPSVLVEYEQEINRICAHMQRAGLVLDSEYNDRLRLELDAEYERYSKIAAEWGVSGVGKRTEIAECLIAMGEDLTEKTDRGAWKTDKKVLLPLADLADKTWDRIGARDPNPLAVAVLHANRARKWRSSFADNFSSRVTADGLIHANVNTMEARTGRMSITKPAIQTLPSGNWTVRRALMAEDGNVMLSTDFDSVELNVLAALGDVKRMKQAIARGEKLHKTTAKLVFGDDYTKPQYGIAKGGNFLKVYGGGLKALAANTGASMDILKRFFSEFDRAYPEVAAYQRTLERQAINNGMALTTITGRRLIVDRDRMYSATNAVVQSTARDCLGQALILMEERGLLPYLRLPIHDEVLASAPAAEAEDVGREIAECMTMDLFGVPITASPEVGGQSWGSLYMKDDHGNFVPELLIKEDPYFAQHPDAARALAA